MPSIYSAFLYFLFDRFLYSTIHVETLEKIFPKLSQLFALVVFVQFIVERQKKSDYKVLCSVFLIFFSLLVSTIIGAGSLHSWGQQAYPPLAMGVLFILNFKTRSTTKKFISAVSNLYFYIVLTNFVVLLINPEAFPPGEYFLSIENQIGYPLLQGFAFMLIDAYYKKNNYKLIIYTIIYIITIFLIFSGSNIVGLCVVLVAILPNPISLLVKKVSFNKLITIGLALFVLIFILDGLSAILSNPLIVYIVEDLLGKNLTLSGRTFIWITVISDWMQSPLFGHGLQDTVNLFETSSGNFLSAHNMALQLLWSGGIMVYLSFIPLILLLSKRLDNESKDLSNVFKSTIVAMIIMYMAEAPGLHIITLMLLACTINTKKDAII